MAVNVLVIAFILFVLFRPDGLAMNELRKLRKGSLDREKISAAWPALAQGTRLVEGSPERVVVEFSDYQCPYCKQAHQVLDSVVREVGGTLVYRHMPLTLIHPEAEGAARAAICAERQGRFREMHDHLFETDRWQRDPDWAREALAAGVADTASFRACLSDPAVARRIGEDRKLAERLGIKVTPSFAGPGGIHTGVPTAADLEDILR
jgi:protein-disulfide isomerase